MSDVKFPEGIKVFKPSDKAPDFIKANVKIDKPTLQAWLNSQPEQFNLVMKESQKGGYYFQVDTYQPKDKSDLPF